jgi:HlyD family secretion protein
VKADISGVIVRLAVEEGENVLAGDLYNSGSSIVTIADLSEMEVQILVDETEVVRTKPGQKATVEVDAFPNQEIAGTVLEVGNSAYNSGPLGAQEAKDFRVRILLVEPPEGLRPGLSARAEIVTETREDVLSVPIESLALRDPAKEAAKRDRKKKGGASAAVAADTVESRADPEVEGVFLVQDGVAVFTPLTTGIAGEKHFEVVSGLGEGATVVRGPFDALRRLASGDRVRVRDEKERRKSAAKEKSSAEEAGE